MTGGPGQDSLAGGPHDIVYSARLGWVRRPASNREAGLVPGLAILQPVLPPW